MHGAVEKNHEPTRTVRFREGNRILDPGLGSAARIIAFIAIIIIIITIYCCYLLLFLPQFLLEVPDTNNFIPVSTVHRFLSALIFCIILAVLISSLCPRFRT